MPPRQFHQFNKTVGLLIGDLTYRDSDENFALDAGVAAPALPDGINERLYEPGVRHALIANNNVMDGGPMPWPEGDGFLDRLEELLKAKVAREKKANEAEMARQKTEMEARAKALMPTKN